MSATSERPYLSKPNSSKIGTIIVFGISGVGKSTACASYIARHPNVLHTSAGALLQEAKGIDSDVLRTEAAQGILQNQTLLVAAVARYRLGREDADILIEAHSIIDNDHELIEVPVDIVRALRPDGLVLLEASPELVFERRQKDLRSRPARTVEELKSQMVVARKACEKYAAELKLPLEVGTVAHDQDLDALIDKLVSRRHSN
jgi:adenylate kinase